MDQLVGFFNGFNQSSNDCPVAAEDALEDAANEEKSIQEEINALEDVIEKEGIEGLKAKLSADSDKWKNVSLHIAVTGSSGAGKSAFVNAILNVRAGVEGSAKVDVTETTATLTKYKHPKNPNFIVWDMPGVGTPNFPKGKYLECVVFDRYDFFMILSKDRFTENDLWLAKQVQERKKRFYFIRSNIDTDISNDKRTHPNAHSAEGVMKKVKQNCHINLIKAGIEEPLVFLVDNLDRVNYEFGKIENQLVEDSDSLKEEAIALSLSFLTRDVLKKKKEILEARIEKRAIEIACLLDEEGKQKLIFDQELAMYKEQFNLDEQTLITNKEIFSLSDKKLKEFETSFESLSEETARKLCTKLLSLFGIHNFLFRLFRRLLAVDSFLYKMIDEKFRYHSRAIFQFSCLALHQNLEEMYKMALKMYGFDDQKGLVKSFMQLLKTSIN